MVGKTERFIVKPKRVQELIYHDMASIETLDLFMGSSLLPESDISLFVRKTEIPPGREVNVEPHKHDASQVYALVGDLTARAFLDGEWHPVEAPACIFIPPWHLTHSA